MLTTAAVVVTAPVKLIESKEGRQDGHLKIKPSKESEA
jgi:hypothetical protein